MSGKRHFKVSCFLVSVGFVLLLAGCYSRYSVGSWTISFVDRARFCEIELFVTNFLTEKGYQKTQAETIEWDQRSVDIITFSRVSSSVTDMPSHITLKRNAENTYVIFFDVFRPVEGKSLKLLREEMRVAIQNEWPDLVMKYEWRVDRRRFLDP